MKDFLTFNSFITPDVLIFFYYIGALGAPLLLWYIRDSVLKKFSSLESYKLLIFIAIFVCMELCWRMMFEAMIGYFDMHNYLYEIKNSMRDLK